MNEALTINGTALQRNPDIIGPKDSTRKTRTSYANNEIMVNASLQTVFANIGRCAIVPSWYPNSQQCIAS